MERFLTFEVPGFVADDEIEEYFRSNFEDLYPTLNLELADDRAGVDDIEIEVFELTAETVTIEYCIEYSAYYGCKDMNYCDNDQRVVKGLRNGRTFTFEVFIPPPPRDTYEEF